MLRVRASRARRGSKRSCFSKLAFGKLGMKEWILVVGPAMGFGMDPCSSPYITHYSWQRGPDPGSGEGLVIQGLRSRIQGLGLGIQGLGSIPRVRLSSLRQKCSKPDHVDIENPLPNSLHHGRCPYTFALGTLTVQPSMFYHHSSRKCACLYDPVLESYLRPRRWLV